MPKWSSKKTRPGRSRSANTGRILGAKVFATISAVEGLKLNKTGKKRLDAQRTRKLSQAERRAEVLRAYAKVKGRK